MTHHISTHIDDLFDKSLLAELAQHPEFVSLTPKNVQNDLPEIIFRQRLKGYHIADRLCRVYVLQLFKQARERGEFFVKWQDLDAAIPRSHDGTLVFAHFAVMKYCSLHEPGMSIAFDSSGYMKSTSVHFAKIRR